MVDLVSIIVPVYNVEKYLDVCISSIIRQTFTNLEILLIDDGSTDQSGLICDEWEKKDKRITVIHKTNGGASDARNVGIEHALGEFILFVDGDDYINLQLVEICYSLLKRYNVDMVCFSYERVKEESNDVSLKSNDKFELEKMKGEELISELICERKCSNSACDKFFKKEIWQTFRFPLGKVNEDGYIMLDLLLSVNDVLVFNQKLYYYRERGGSVTHSKGRKFYYDTLKVFEIRCEKLKEKKELYYLALSKYLGWLIKIYWREKGKRRKDTLDLFRKKMQSSVLRYIYWKSGILYIAFYMNPQIYLFLIRLSKEKEYISLPNLNWND